MLLFEIKKEDKRIGYNSVHLVALQCKGKLLWNT